jgi:cysteine synthase A
MRTWVNQAISKIEADFKRSADTHLLKVELPAIPNINLYLKDESTHPTGSLKHRLARSLFLYGLCNGLIDEGTTIIESSSGSTAVSEAYFAKLLGLPFIAVVPKNTSHEKIEKIGFYNGQCHFVEPADIYAESERLARELDGHYMDQFTYAERATDWRGNNNIAESMFDQMSREAAPIPAWIVVSAGTGGTSATIGRFLRYKRHDTQLCVADPEHSVFYDAYQTGDLSLTGNRSSNVEGIGRPRVEPSFLPSLIDRMIRVPDAASYATIHFSRRRGYPAAWSRSCATMAIATSTATTTRTGSTPTASTWCLTATNWTLSTKPENSDARQAPQHRRCRWRNGHL